MARRANATDDAAILGRCGREERGDGPDPAEADLLGHELAGVAETEADAMTSIRYPPLNEAQVRTLRWIADGCPDGVMAGFSHRVSAVALQRRRLAKVCRRRGAWSAVITDAGAYYLEHGDYPPQAPSSPMTTSSEPPSHATDPVDEVPSEEPAPSSAHHTCRAESASGGQVATRRAGPTDAMIAALLQADHRLEIPYAEAERYERLARSATRFKKVPEGMRVRVERNWREHKAWAILEDLPSWMTATLDPIEVAATLRQPTDVVIQLRNRDDFKIRHSEVNRALRVIDALVRAVRTRGYAAKATEAPRKDRWGYLDRHEGNRGQFAIVIGPDRY